METYKSFVDVEAEVMAEVNRARHMWGIENDSNNTLNDWIAFINIYLGKASSMNAPRAVMIRDLRKAAVLAISALFHAENDRLAPRHYDGCPRPLSLPEIDENRAGYDIDRDHAWFDASQPSAN